MLNISRGLWPDTSVKHRWLGAILAVAGCVPFGIRIYDAAGMTTTLRFVAGISGTVIVLGLLLVTFVLIAIDFSLHRLPNDATVTLASIGLLFFIWWRFFGQPQHILLQAIAAATVLPLLLLVLHLLSPRSLGFGDVKLGVGMGLILGNFGGLSGLWALFLASVLASVHFLIVLPRSNRGRQTAAAFGPWLILGSSLALYMS